MFCNANLLPMDTELLTTAEACQVLGFKHRSSLTRYVAERRIEAVRLGDRLFFDPTEVARFKSEREAA